MGKVIPTVLLMVLGFGLGFGVFRGAAGQAGAGPEAAVGSDFTYQGLLEVAGEPADGPYDFQFKLFDVPIAGVLMGMVNVDDVAVADGLFSVQLDFGPGAFAGEAERWLELAVREGDSDGAYSTLAGRQRLTPTPYALYAFEAGSVAWDGLTGVPVGFADGVDDVGLSVVTWTDVQNRPAGLDDGDDDTTYTAGTGLALAGTQFSAAGSPYDNMLVVAKSGGDFSSVQAALDSIGDAGVDNPYLVYVAPGVYNETVTLKPYVTVEGAGEGTTIIRGTGGSQEPGDGSGSATLVGADNAALRQLTVESIGTGQDYAIAILNDNASPAMSQVTASATGGDFINYGVYNDFSWAEMRNVTASAEGGDSSFGVANNSASPVMSDVTATGSGGTSINAGVYNGTSSATMSHVTASATGGRHSWGVWNDGPPGPTMTDVTASGSGCIFRCVGVYNEFSGPTIRHSVLEGSLWSVFIADLLPGVKVKVANSQLIGPVDSGLACFNNYDANLNAVACP